jgi:hypothetical protein
MNSDNSHVVPTRAGRDLPATTLRRAEIRVRGKNVGGGKESRQRLLGAAEARYNVR